MLFKHRLYLINLKVMGKTIANELLFIVAIAPVFFADDRCPRRLSTTISLRWLKSLKSAMAFREFRKVMMNYVLI